MVVSHNIPALFTNLSMRRADRGLNSAMMRLSSGTRINSAREDAAGLAIANKLSYQVGGLRRASENATHGISMIQTAEGAMNEIHNMLQRMRELAVQAAHDTLTPENRSLIQIEIDQLTDEVNSIASRTEYNRMRLINGEADRVTENRAWLGGVESLTRGVVTTLFVSQQVPPGHLNYTIQSAGLPALVRFQPPDVFTEATSFTVNGLRFAIDASAENPKTWEQVRVDVNRQLQFEGISLHEGEGDMAGYYFFIANQAGSAHSIRVTGNTELLGLPPGETRVYGTDAVVHTNDFDVDGTLVEGGLFDANGVRVPGSTLAATASGNQVLIRGSNGEEINLNIQVRFNPSTGGFEFPGAEEFVDLRLSPVYDVNGDIVPDTYFRMTDLITEAMVDPDLRLLRDSDGELVEGRYWREEHLIWPAPAETENYTQIFDYTGAYRGWVHNDNIETELIPEPITDTHTRIYDENADFLGWVYNDNLEADNMTTDVEGGLRMSKTFRDFGPLMLQIGPSHNTAMAVHIPRLNAETLGLVEFVGGVMNRFLNYRNGAGATAAIGIMDNAIDKVSRVRSRLGAYQNRLESTVRNLEVAAENTEISRSRIQDADVARESTRFAQYNVMFQAAMAILGQANQRPQQLISLLQ